MADLKASAPSPSDIPGMSKQEKIQFVIVFQKFDRLFSQLKAFTNYEGVEKYGFSDDEYAQYAAHYKNVIEELRKDPPDKPGPGPGPEPTLDGDYEPRSYSVIKIDYEYIVSLIQDITDGDDDEETFLKKLSEIREYVEKLSRDNPKLGALLSEILDNIAKDRAAYAGADIYSILEEMRSNAVNMVLTQFANKWKVNIEAVRYAAEYHKNGEIPNSNVIKDSFDYTAYKDNTENPLPKFKCRNEMISELEEVLRNEIMPLQERQ